MLKRNFTACQLSITYDDEPGPEGFERVSRNLAKGGVSGRKAFLWLRRQAQQQISTPDRERKSDGPMGLAVAATPAPTSTPTPDAGSLAAPGAQQRLLPIGEVVIGFGSSDPNVEEEAEIAERESAAGGQDAGAQERKSRLAWERLDRSLDPAASTDGGGGGAVFLWFRRGSDDDSLSWSSHSLEVKFGGSDGLIRYESSGTLWHVYPGEVLPCPRETWCLLRLLAPLVPLDYYPVLFVKVERAWNIIPICSPRGGWKWRWWLASFRIPAIPSVMTAKRCCPPAHHGSSRLATGWTPATRLATGALLRW